MILEIIAMGFLSAFALGPASFNIIRLLVTKKKFPWSAILGFLLADLIFILLALYLLRTSFFNEPLVRFVLTLFTAFALTTYALKILLKPESPELPDFHLNPGFRQSFLLSLSNIQLLLIYAGLFSSWSLSLPQIPYSGALFYFLSFYFCFL